MSELLNVLNNIRTLRLQAKEMNLNSLEQILKKLTVVVEERRNEKNKLVKD